VWVPNGKTEDSLAVLEVPDYIMDVLLQHRDRYAFLPSSLYVFPGLEDPGLPVDSDKVTKDFPYWLADHGLRRIRFHDLRHSAASMYLSLGVPLWQVSKILRHSSIKMTNDTYAHLFPQANREAADVMNGEQQQAL
jgi:integrase